MVVDLLASRAGVAGGRDEADAWTAEADVGGERVLLVKPQAFMNRRGVVVEGVLSRRGVGSKELIVILDDVALPLGSLRVRERGSHGGHNGLRSLIEVLGTDEFPRVRIGVGKEEPPGDLADYVLSDFPEEDVVLFLEVVGFAGDAVECLVREGPVAAMNRYNGAQRA
jgi:PTH1 family peptidyl-tRNA hydrolase